MNNKKYNSSEFIYETIKAKYELWCNYLDKHDERDTRSFKAFLKTDLGREYNQFWVKKNFIEKYFGLKFIYNKQTQKWSLDKN